MFKNTIDIKVKGKNIERFIRRLNNHNIDILNINYLKYNTIIIRINKDDLEGLELLKTIYEIEIVGINGIDKIKQILKKNTYLIIGFIISIIILLILTNTIFEVVVIHNNKELRKTLLTELDNYGIKKYHFKKSYDDIQNIKKKILDKYQDEIEWLEIENVGTKYIVRVEERIITKEDNYYQDRNIVAKKDATLLKIEAIEGEVLKEKYEYVKKGDIVISGDIKLYEETKNKTMAKGKIYGEVWYKATIEYPYRYKEKNLTGKMKKVFALKIFNKYFEFFNFKKYKTKIRKDKTLIKHSFLPIKLVYEEQYETKEYSKKLTKKQAINKAITRVKKHINEKLDEKEYIIDTKKLKVDENNSKIILELFVSVCEDITDYAEIIEEEKIEE